MEALSEIPQPVWILIAAVFGLVFGSFVTALSYRLPRGESIAHGRSRCPSCGHTLTAVDLVPVLSWVFHKGTCRHCKAKVPWRYPAIELITAVLFAAAVAVLSDPIHIGLLLAMTPVIVALAIIDIESERLPNGLVAVLALLAVGWRWFGDGDLLMGLAIAAGVLVLGALTDAAYKSRKGHGGLGFGDVKLMALGALALPLGPFLLFLTLTGFFGVVFGVFWQRMRQSSTFPFGPAILASFWIGLAAGGVILQSVIASLSG